MGGRRTIKKPSFLSYQSNPVPKEPEFFNQPTVSDSEIWTASTKLTSKNLFIL